MELCHRHWIRKFSARVKKNSNPSLQRLVVCTSQSGPFSRKVEWYALFSDSLRVIAPTHPPAWLPRTAARSILRLAAPFPPRLILSHLGAPFFMYIIIPPTLYLSSIKEILITINSHLDFHSPRKDPKQIPSFLVTVFRVCFPKIQHLDRMNILSWRSSRNDMCGKDFPDLPLNQDVKPYARRALPNIRRKKNVLSQRNRPCSFPRFTTLSSYFFHPISFSHNSPLVIESSVRTFRFGHFLSLHFFMKVSVSCKTYVK